MAEENNEIQPGEFRMVAKTMPGLEAELARELVKIGARNVEEHRRAVSFVGDKGTMYKANYLLRTALRVLMPVEQFEASNEQELYDGIRRIDWEQWMGPDDTLAVDATANSEFFDHTFYLAQKTKDAIVDQFRDKHGRRPSVEKFSPTLRINIHVNEASVTVSLDSSGDSLHKRGYREDTGRAPLNEVLAAGMIALSGWNKRSRFIDPMCGSGTLLIEAALLATNVPAGWFRESFGFQRWRDYEPELWEKITEGAISRINNETVEILGSDVSYNVLRKARENIKLAKVDDIVKTACQDFFDSEPPSQGAGLVMLNPPYGERMAQDDVAALYKQIGDTLKKKYSGYQAWMITSNPDGLKAVGLRPSRKIALWNGPLECRFVRYDLYEGTKKIHKLR
ncbi:MAG: THUMP domain-containing protein [Bacteroidia bacterium]|jgi:putative N6-adenine-specific DNA methylase|nr:THUMP domain-containing protein [Bacteroidia bacterium]